MTEQSDNFVWKSCFFSEIAIFVAVLEGFFFNRDQNKVAVTGGWPLFVAVIEGF